MTRYSVSRTASSTRAAFAAACGRTEVADDLVEVLEPPLDEDSEIESERLSTVLRLLGLPGWLVAANALPKHVWGGPDPADFTRLVRGRQMPPWLRI
jgi:hypothetical protein